MSSFCLFCLVASYLPAYSLSGYLLKLEFYERMS